MITEFRRYGIEARCDAGSMSGPAQQVAWKSISV